MAITGHLLGRPVIYTPLPLSSVYTGVNAAVAVGAALQDRVHSGRGREVTASRVAGGLSAIGALALTSTGLPPHLSAPAPAGLPEGMTREQWSALCEHAATDAKRQLWLEQRVIPIGAPYRCADGRMALVMSGANRRATQRLYEHFGIWKQLAEQGLVDESAFDPAAVALRGRNVADSPSLDFKHAGVIAELLERIMATKTAAEWEAELAGLGIPTAKVLSFPEWMADPQARRAGLTAEVAGAPWPQLGRAAWLGSAQPYPPLILASEASRLPTGAPTVTAPGAAPKTRPLEGYRVIDMTNVIAGPNCARMLAELGASVVRIEQPAPGHPPLAMTNWGAEAGSGKQSIILDTDTPDGREVLGKLLLRTDFVVVNKSDAQCKRLGIDPESLHAINPKAILIQLTAHHGEKRGGRHDYPGYDPVGQAITGIMHRFGPVGCPTYHGIASCVDYLCGYLAAWAGVSALFARERRGDGKGDHAQTSLTAAASLTQLLFQHGEPQFSASGPNAGGRLCALSDGWIFICDGGVAENRASDTVGAALARLKGMGIEAVRVNTVRELADHHEQHPSRTIRFVENSSEGWASKCFVPTWFCFDDAPPEARAVTPRFGSSADAILAEVGYGSADIAGMRTSGVVTDTDWARGERPDPAPSSPKKS